MIDGSAVLHSGVRIFAKTMPALRALSDWAAHRGITTNSGGRLHKCYCAPPVYVFLRPENRGTTFSRSKPNIGEIDTIYTLPAEEFLAWVSLKPKDILVSRKGNKYKVVGVGKDAIQIIFSGETYELPILSFIAKGFRPKTRR